MPQGDSAPRLLQTITLPEGIQEVVFIRDPSETPISSGPFLARLIAKTKSGVSFFTLSRGLNDDFFSIHLTQSHDLFTPDNNYPWFNLRVGSTGRRVMWITPILSLPPQLTYGVLREEAFDSTALVLDRKVYCDIQDSPTGSTTTLCAFPLFDFDDALGLVVVGNVYGELCLYDLVDTPSTRLWPESSLTLEEVCHPDTFASLVCPSSQAIRLSLTHSFPFTQQPLNLELPPLVPIPPSVCLKTPCLPSVLNYCILRDLESTKLPGFWSTDWENFSNTGSGRDFQVISPGAWSTVIGFLGNARPLAFHHDACLLKAGGLYFLLFYSDDDGGLLVFDNGVTLVDIVKGLPEEGDNPTYPPCRWADNVKRSAECQMGWYRGVWKKEARLGRNRWVELKERGGFPGGDLQVMLPPRVMIS